MHTPTPWNRIGHMIYSKGHEIASTDQMNPTTDKEVIANASLIVQAVNSHKQLLEACKLAFERLKPPEGNIKKYFHEHVAYAALGTAIYQAEGGDK